MHVNKKDINNIDLGCFKNYDGLNLAEFLNNPGTEHYKLLAYLSTLYNNIDIFDIGTHMGSSALALSYNQSNKIYTFDLIDKIPSGINSIKSRSNIFFSNDNLLDEKERIKWEEKLLASPLIFLDIDPHDGHLEYQFYLYLLDKKYTGIIICDDIYYFKGMRDNFWYLIPSNHKTDITHLGHWSGTGIIFFNHTIKFEDTNDPSDNWTLVTAYFDLTKMPDASTEINKRPSSHYLDSANSTLSLDHNMIIFCEEENKEQIMRIRPRHLHSKTLIITQSFEDFPLTKHRNKIISNRQEHPYAFDNRNTASYYLFCMSRYAMLKRVINENIFGSTHFAWINICIERMGYSNLKHIEEALACNRDKFSTCYIDYVSPNIIKNTPLYFNRGRCSMCSGFFTGNSYYMNEFCNAIEAKFLEYLEMGYGHADEQLYSPIYFERPDIFEWYLGDYFQMITNYKYVYELPSAPINNLIRNSFNDKNWKICNEACNKLLDSINRGITKLTNNELSMFLYFINNQEPDQEINNQEPNNHEITGKKDGYYDFMEIGTSDFDTLIQTCDESTYGISIDPLKYYLDRLPDKKNVKKLCLAVSDTDGEIEVYTIEESDIIKYNLPPWTRGCNRIGMPHPTINNILISKGLNTENIWTKYKVPMVSFETLVKNNLIVHINYLKIDTEGHDCVIMKAVAKEIQKNNQFIKPKKIRFETNVLSSTKDQNDIIALFGELGYYAVREAEDTVLHLK